MGYLVNPSNITVEVDDEKECLKLTQENPQFRFANEDEIYKYKVEHGQIKIQNNPDSSVYFYTVASHPDGYGMTQAFLYEALLKEKVNLTNQYDDQKLAFIFHSPIVLDAIRNPMRLLYTMFESTKIPKVWKRFLKKVDKIIVPSKFCQKAFTESGIKTEVVPLGYNHNEFYYRKKNSRKTFTFLHYDAFNTRKGWDIVFNAFTQEFKKTENVKLILKSIQSLSPIAIPRSQYPNIEVIREQYTPEQLRMLHYNSDCFVFPSRGEGFGLPPLEALACGSPVIIPNGSGMNEYFNKKYFLEIDIKSLKPAHYNRYKGEDVGDFIEPDIKSLRKQMRYAFTNRKEIYEMGERGSKWVKENYSIKQTAEKIGEIINEMLKLKAKRKISNINNLQIESI